MSVNPQNGLIHLASQHTVEETMQRFETLLSERGVTIFARVDHSGEAARLWSSPHARSYVARSSMSVTSSCCGALATKRSRSPMM
jgi:hypothetical protein